MVAAFRRWDETVGAKEAEAVTSATAAPSASQRERLVASADFRELRLEGIEPRVRQAHTRSATSRSTVRARRVHRAARPLGLRQVDGAQLHRRAAGADRRRDLARRAAHRQPAAGAARLRHGVPELRAVPAHDGARQCRLRPRHAGRAEGRGRPADRRGDPPRPARGPRPQAAGPALGRPAAARRHRPRHRRPPAARADGRAALESRRQAAPRDARRKSAASTSSSARPPSTSPTTRTRRSRSPTASSSCATAASARSALPRTSTPVPPTSTSPSSWASATACRAASSTSTATAPASRSPAPSSTAPPASRSLRRGRGRYPPGRPVPVPEGGIPATVAAAEYRGREFYGTATTAGGVEIGFTAVDRPTPGDPIRLSAPPDRVLVFQGR